MTFEELLPSLRPWVENLANVWPGAAIKPYFAQWQVLHILSLVVLGGASILLNLRLIGRGLGNEPPSEIEGNLRPWLHVGVIGIVVSGVLIGAANADRLYTSEAFTVKMLALVAGVLLTYGVSMPIARAEGRASRGVKITFGIGAAVFALALWIFGTGELINPGLFHMLTAAALIVFFVAGGVLRWVFTGVLAILLGAQFVATHLIVKPDDYERLDPLNIAFAWIFAAWIFGVALAHAVRAPATHEGRLTAKLAGYATILVWVVGGAAGRWIAFS